MIYLEPDQDQLLKRIARDEKVSETEVVRRALELYARHRTEDPLLKLIGMFEGGPRDGSIRHDEYIIEGPVAD